MIALVFSVAKREYLSTTVNELWGMSFFANQADVRGNNSLRVIDDNQGNDDDHGKQGGGGRGKGRHKD